MGKISNTFDNNIKSIKKLINFDRQILDFTISSISELHISLKTTQDIDNPSLNGQKVLDNLKKIRDNDSLRSSYETINNQAVVLLVSYFASSVADLFRDAASYSLKNDASKLVADSEFKFKISEIIELSKSLDESIGDMLIAKVGITFQDMKSIQREFKKYFNIEIIKDQSVNNIILGQACRHTIAHDGAKANTRVINQIKNATPRTLKLDIQLNQVISFTEEEISTLAASMQSYVNSLEEKVESYKLTTSHAN